MSGIPLGRCKKYTLDLFFQALSKEIKVIYYFLISKQKKTEKSDFPAFFIPQFLR